MTPRVSVLLPVWNASATLAVALGSVQRQTFSDWECIVVDDGSSDGTDAIVRAATAADPRVVLVQTPHRGLVPALNEGLTRCRAPLIARMDADDAMHRERLARQCAALVADPALAAVGCHVRIFPRSGMTDRAREYERWLNGLCSADDVRRDAFVECPIAHPALMMRREMAELGYADRGWPEDYDLVLRALAAGLKLGIVSARLLSWRDHAASLCRTSAVYDVERFTACKAHYLACGFLAAAEEYVLWGYGDTGRVLRRALAVHGKRPSHIVEVKTSRIGQRIHGADVIPIEALPSLRGRRILVSVARQGPRQEIRAAMEAMQFVEGADYVCCA
jgi:glycosyltransferase involved in cell wall biosynthesis